jgi:methionyl-tRNA formyltransferase
MKIIFMGTPQFACPTLQKLIDDKNFEIVGVFTREPQIAGRGHKLQNSQIHELALKNNLKVFTPKSLKNAESQKDFLDLKADAAVVVAYGLLLPQQILDGTKFGCFNIHPSLLPRWRGAAPIQRTIMAGDKETAICIMQMDAGLDSGDVVACENFDLNGSETYSELEKKFAEVGADLMIETLKNAQNGNLNPIKQNATLATYAKKLEKSECEIDWKKSAQEIDCKIRGLSGSLGAFFMYKDEKIKIFTAEIIDKNLSIKNVGEINEKLWIQCGQGIIRPTILQRPGKKPMSVEEFLRGFLI